LQEKEYNGFDALRNHMEGQLILGPYDVDPGLIFNGSREEKLIDYRKNMMYNLEN